MSLVADFSKHNYFFVMPCYDGKVCSETTVSLLETSGKLGQMNVSHQFRLIRSGALIDAVRNELVHYFLHHTNADTIILIDSDISFTFEDIERLLVFSEHYPIVCGSYTSKTEPASFVVTVADNKLNEHGLLPINAIGAGFVAIQRKVFDQLNVDSYKDKKLGTNVKAFFRLLIENGQYIGEDIYFFNKCVEAGFQPMLDPEIKLGHIGIKEYNTPFKAVLPLVLKEKTE